MNSNKEDKMSIVLSFEDGSIGTVNYFGNGKSIAAKRRKSRKNIKEMNNEGFRLTTKGTKNTNKKRAFT